MQQLQEQLHGCTTATSVLRANVSAAAERVLAIASPVIYEYTLHAADYHMYSVCTIKIHVYIYLFINLWGHGVPMLFCTFGTFCIFWIPGPFPGPDVGFPPTYVRVLRVF